MNKEVRESDISLFFSKTLYYFPLILVETVKLGLSWVTWPLTYLVMYALSLFIKVNVTYEDPDLSSIKRPLIIISNHRKIFDPWYISFAIPFGTLFGKIFPLRPYSTLHISKKNVLGYFILKSMRMIKLTYFIYNTIQVPENASFDEKISPIVTALRKKQSILFFPEGRLSLDDSISDFKKGIVRIQQLSGAQILPVAIRYDKGVYVSVGKPITIPKELIENHDSDEFQAARNFLREKVLDLYSKTKK